MMLAMPIARGLVACPNSDLGDLCGLLLSCLDMVERATGIEPA